jgi:hypothetical protein
MHRLRSRLFASPFTVGALPRQPYFFIAPHKPHDDVLSGAVAAWTDSHVRSPIRTLNLVRVGIGNVARSLSQALAFPGEHGVLNLQPIILSDRALRISFSVEPVNVAMWSNGSSTRSSTVAASRRAMRSWQRTTSLSFGY